MFQKFTLGFSLIVGLAAGLVISYFGLNTVLAKGLSLLHRDALQRLANFQDQAMAMSDDALQLRSLLESFRWKGDAEVFQKVTKARATLAGSVDFGEKVEAAQALEGALLDSAAAWKAAGEKNRDIAANYYWQEWGRRWN
jgi:hypothetical protein